MVEELELDPPKTGELQVRMAASGVCHSDLHVAQGIHPTDLPVVLGHEGAGIVEEVGPGVGGFAQGDHVLLTWLPYCGHCRQCTRGWPNRCENTAWYDSTMEDGTCRLHSNGRAVHHYNTSSFAEQSVVPARTAVKVDPSLPLTELALMGCAVMAFFFVPWLDRSPVKSIRYRGWIYRSFLFAFAISFIVLGYLGLQHVTPAFTLAARIFTAVYFAFFILMPWYTKIDTTKPVPERVTYHAH